MTAPTMPGQPVDIPLPPEVDRAWGYPGESRYVVFFIDGDDVLFTDGIQTGHAARWAFQEYSRHRAVEPLLRGFDLAQDCLCLDRETNRASVCTGPEAADFLRQVRPPL